MKKIFLFILMFSVSSFLVAQNTSAYIYLNASSDNQGVMYKSPDGTGTYVVLPKNTLYSISKIHGMSVQELQDLNSISGTQILIGQKLKVKSVNALAQGLSVNQNTSLDLGAVNKNLEKEHLTLKETGDLEISASHPAMLRAQKLKEEGVDLEKAKGTHISKENELWYVPNDNDNFHTIATKYDMDFENLKNLNAMNDYLFRKGMVLVVVPGKLFGIKAMPESMPDVKVESSAPTETGYSTLEIPVKKAAPKIETEVILEKEAEVKTDSVNEQTIEEKVDAPALDSVITE